MPAELRVPFPGSHLEVVPVDPLQDPTDVAVASQEATSEAEASERLVEVAEGLGRHASHGVAVHGQQSQAGQAEEGRFRQLSQLVKSEVKNLKIGVQNSKLK